MPDLLTAPHDHVAMAWPWLRDRITFGVEKSKGRMTLEGLYAKAESGEWDLHTVYQDDDEAGTQENGPDRVLAVLLTQIYDEMGGDRVLSVRFLAGKNKVEWLWLIEALELFAVQNGATIMSIPGRRGWYRDLKDYGYREEAVVLEKRLRPKATGHAGRQAANGSDHARDRSGCASAVQPDLQPSGQPA